MCIYSPKSYIHVQRVPHPTFSRTLHAHVSARVWCIYMDMYLYVRMHMYMYVYVYVCMYLFVLRQEC